MILVFHIWISIWIIQATATALVQALRNRRLEDKTKSEFVIKISLKSSIALTLRLEPFLAGGHRACCVMRDSGKEKWSICAATKGFLLCPQLFHNCCKAGRVVSQPFSGWIDRFGKKDQFQDHSVSNYLPLDRKIWNHLGLHNFSQIWLISTGVVSTLDTGSTFVRWSIFW